jgi:hypothetical protein
MTNEKRNHERIQPNFCSDLVCTTFIVIPKISMVDCLVSKNRYKYQTHMGKKDRLHRHIMQEHIGRWLRPGEHVYHLNGDPNDNRIENLAIITKKCKNERENA